MITTMNDFFITPDSMISRPYSAIRIQKYLKFVALIKKRLLKTHKEAIGHGIIVGKILGIYNFKNT